MMHTGDQYEARARAARHHELRRLTKAVAGFLFGMEAPVTGRMTRPEQFECANDRTCGKSRAA